jgi:hypothetical protein
VWSVLAVARGSDRGTRRRQRRHSHPAPAFPRKIATRSGFR